MSKLSVPIEPSELIRLRQQAQQAEIKEQRALLKNFLTAIKQMTTDQAALHLPKTLNDTQRLAITQPQVFLSYAWEEKDTPKLVNLHAFLTQLADDLEAVGLTPWIDLRRMTGRA